jgi:hypothetical protein
MRHHDPGSAIDGISANLRCDPIALAGTTIIDSRRGQLCVKYIHHGSQRAQARRNWNSYASNHEAIERKNDARA